MTLALNAFTLGGLSQKTGHESRDLFMKAYLPKDNTRDERLDYDPRAFQQVLREEGFLPSAEFDFRHEDNQWLVDAVQFWIRVFAHYDDQKGIVHDANLPQIIYEVLDFSHLDGEGRRRLTLMARSHWQDIAQHVYDNWDHPHRFSQDERHVFILFAKNGGKKTLQNSIENGRIRVQRGIRNRFKDAIAKSSRYLPELERIFKQEGLPIELTRIPFIESSFDSKAKSHAGALGMWQFMPATGREFMVVNHSIDERRDPFRSARAAARFLRQNYEALQSWPLAITAYNHGRNGMLRAVQQVGTRDFKPIWEEYQSPSFGFASRNFYFEFLAALEVERRSSIYFEEVPKASPLQNIEVGIADPMNLAVLMHQMGLDPESLRSLNPAFSQELFEGKGRVPAGQILRLPADWGAEDGGPREAFWKRYQDIPDNYKERERPAKTYGMR
jgi:membrane-bound lytic murein transglycosylase D